MNHPEHPDQPKKEVRAGFSPPKLNLDEIRKNREEIQERLRQKAPEKNEEKKRANATYLDYARFGIKNFMTLISELYQAQISIDGYQIDLPAVQLFLKNQKKAPLPVCPHPSSEIQKMIDAKQVSSLQGEMSFIGMNNAILICSDGVFFQVKIDESRQCFTFLIYTDEYLE